jgi:hypothetical protein
MGQLAEGTSYGEFTALIVFLSLVQSSQPVVDMRCLQKFNLSISCW